MKPWIALALIASLTLPAGLSQAAAAPSVGIDSFSQLKTPLPLPYDQKADAEAQVKSAAARARAAHKLLLIDLGGDWCADCRIVAGVMALPTISPFVAKHYVLVTVDVGHMNRNLEIPSRYGVKRLDAVPALLVIDPKAGVLLNRSDIFALGDARHMSPQSLADWLAKWPAA
jgi:thiol-disulfide isomerase/thioredoxin